MLLGKKKKQSLHFLIQDLFIITQLKMSFQEKRVRDFTKEKEYKKFQRIVVVYKLKDS